MVTILHYISVGIGGVGVAVIVWGVLLMLYRLVRLECIRPGGECLFQEQETLRHQLGAYLILGLEFLIAADIIGTVTHPTLKDIAVLASIVGIRTVISYFLDREIASFVNDQSDEDTHCGRGI